MTLAAVELAPQEVGERVPGGGIGEPAQHLAGLLEAVVQDEEAGEEQGQGGGTGVASEEPPVDPRGAFGTPLGGVRTLDALEQHRGRAVARAALPDAPGGQGPARAGEKIAGAHPGGHEPRILARQRDEKPRGTPGIGLGERRLVAEAAHHLLLAGEGGRLSDAQQELCLDGEGLRPSPRRGVEVKEAAPKPPALRLREARPLERLGGGPQVAAALAGVGEEVEEAGIEAHAHESLVDHLARGTRIPLLEIALREEREARHVGGRAALAPQELRSSLPRVPVPEEVARPGRRLRAPRVALRPPPCAPAPPAADAGAPRRKEPDDRAPCRERPQQHPRQRRPQRPPRRQPHDGGLPVQEHDVARADHEQRHRNRHQPARHDSAGTDKRSEAKPSEHPPPAKQRAASPRAARGLGASEERSEAKPSEHRTGPQMSYLARAWLWNGSGSSTRGARIHSRSRS